MSGGDGGGGGGEGGVDEKWHVIYDRELAPAFRCCQQVNCEQHNVKHIKQCWLFNWLMYKKGQIDEKLKKKLLKVEKYIVKHPDKQRRY